MMTSHFGVDFLIRNEAQFRAENPGPIQMSSLDIKIVNNLTL